VVRKELRGLANFLRKPAGDVIFLGPLSAIGGMSLFLVLPALLVMFAVTTAILWALIPWLVAAIVMVITWKIMDWAGTPDRWKYTLAIVFGLISLTPTFIGWVHQATFSSVATTATTQGQAVQAQGFLGGILDVITEGPMFIASFMVLVFIAIGLASIARLGSPASFVAGFLGIALGVGIALNVVGAGAATSLGLPGGSTTIEIANATTPSGEFTKGPTESKWVWHKHSSWLPPCADRYYTGTIGSLVDRSWREKEEIPGERAHYTWDYIEYETTFQVRETEGETGAPGFTSVTTTFEITPKGDFDDYLKVEGSPSGELSFMPRGTISTRRKFDVTVGGPGKSGSLKITATIGKRTKVKEWEREPKRPKTRPESSKPGGIPNYIWILAIGGVAVPATVYAWRST